MKSFLLILFGLLSFTKLNAQTQLTQKWLMAFHVCGSGCNGFQDHQVYLAESDDLATWTLVPGFVPYPGSVPDIITRQNRLYLFTPGKVKRFTQGTGFTDTNPVGVTVLDANNNPVNFVDPSPILDSQGNIVLFFLNSTGIMGDPAGCNPYPCTKYFDSATEVPGSDGTQFILDNGHRYEINLQAGTASDPDLFEGSNGYYLYISRGGSTAAYFSSTLQGSYGSLGLPNDILTNEGGIPAGIYNSATLNYHTFVHSNVSGSVVIKSKSHADYSQSIQNLNTIISGTIIGMSNSDKTESPGICKNELINTQFLSNLPNHEIKLASILNNSGEIEGWKIIPGNFEVSSLKLYTIQGSMLEFTTTNYISGNSLPKGNYLIEVEILNKEKVYFKALR